MVERLPHCFQKILIQYLNLRVTASTQEYGPGGVRERVWQVRSGGAHRLILTRAQQLLP